MTTGPTDKASGRGRMRASHADRDQAIDVLKAAFVHGRLAPIALALKLEARNRRRSGGELPPRRGRGVGHRAHWRQTAAEPLPPPDHPRPPTAQAAGRPLRRRRAPRRYPIAYARR